jgi:hypothetical protein
MNRVHIVALLAFLHMHLKLSIIEQQGDSYSLLNISLTFI